MNVRCNHAKESVITGITPSGSPHLGNYIGAINPGLNLVKKSNVKSYFFIADYHSLINIQDRELRKKYVYEVASTWLACGLETKEVIFYKQSDISEILELYWIISSITAKGLLNRNHAYKAYVEKNVANKIKDIDSNISMGLFNYPILMAADILIFDSTLVPIGVDQVQHIEITRDIAHRFNYIYKKDIFVLPKYLTLSKATVRGLDGKKMSKSYNNTIPLFTSSKILYQKIMKVITNSQSSNEPKETQNCTLFELYRNFASSNDINELKKMYEIGTGWKDIKQIVFEKINMTLNPMREKYEYFISNPKIVDSYLEIGASKAKILAQKKLMAIKETIGI